MLRHPLPDAVWTTLGGVRYLRARGQFHLATNRGLAAVSDLQQCRRILREQDLDLPAIAAVAGRPRGGEPRAGQHGASPSSWPSSSWPAPAG